MDEKFLYHIWDAGHINNSLKTISGKRLNVTYQGQFNTQRGPDFVNAILEIEGETLNGAVEIHVNTQDWKKHNHQEDEYYNSVILHAVLNHNSTDIHTIKENGDLVEIVELKGQLSHDIVKLMENATPGLPKSGYDYCELLSAIDTDRLLAILSIHGRQRFMGKVRRFNASLSISDFDQILYEGMMEAIGYDKNKFNMFQLAQSIAIENLKRWKAEGMDALSLTSILCCSSGLLAKSINRLDPDSKTKLLAAYERQQFFGRKISIDWQLFRIRPVNHPLLRLIKLSAFVFHALPYGLLNYLIQKVEQESTNPKERYLRFTELLSVGKSELLNSDTGFGKTVINNIYINIYLPIMYLYAQKVSDGGLSASVMESWNSFGALPENYITRFMGRHINKGQIAKVNKSSLYQQGLMDIFYRTCRYHLCEECMGQNKLYG